MTVRFITRTAVLLALTLVFQYAGRFIPLGQNSNFIVGPLVNACLLIATYYTGLWSGAIISAAAPVAAVLTTHTPVSAFLLPFIPVVALGNFTLVLFFHLFREKNRVAGIALGTALKFCVLFGGVNLYLYVLQIGANFAGAVTFLFGWPQLITAVVGSMLALAVIKALGKSVEPI